MAYIYQNTVGTQLFEFDELPSTNDKIRELHDSKMAGHGAVLKTLFQTKGRGQSGNLWESEKGKNLLISVLLEPATCSADEQVYINLVVGLALYDFVNRYFPARTKIKWPNDIYVDDSKIAGILIENSLQGSVIKQSIIGIGLNINQKNFSVPKAISMSILSAKDFNINDCYAELISCINKRYDELCLHLKYKLMNDYNSVLYRKDSKAFFKVNDRVIEGEISGIDPSGKLIVMSNGIKQVFANKEIEYL